MAKSMQCRAFSTLSLLLCLSGGPGVAAQELVLTVAPLYSLPLTAPNNVLSAASFGGSLSASLPFGLFGLSWLTPAAGLGYTYSGLTATSGSLSTIEAQAGLLARVPVTPWMDGVAGVSVHGGYYLLNAPGQSASGFSPGFSMNAGADFRLGPLVSAGAGIMGMYDVGMYAYLRPFISGSVHLGAKPSSGQTESQPQSVTPRPEPLSESAKAPSGNPGLVLAAAPLYSLPLGAPKDVLSASSFGGSLSASLPFGLFGLPWLTPAVGLGYVSSGLTATTGSLSAVDAQAGVSARVPAVPWLDLVAGAYLRGGYYMLNAPGQSASGFSPGLSMQVGTDFRIGSTVSLGLGVQGGYDFGMYGYLRPFLSASVHLLGGGQAPDRTGPQPKPSTPPKPTPLVGDTEQKAQPAPANADAVSVALEGVFPVFYKYYADHPFGSVTISNTSTNPWTDVRVTFSMRQFMDLPATLPAISSIPAGQSVNVDLVSLFNDSILSITEATKISGELIVDYQEKGKPQRLASTVALRVYDRNAMTWADDRRAAAFITAKDPVILSFAKGLAGDVSASRNTAISDGLQVAAGIHEALSIYGVNYVPDPTSIFAGSKTRTEVDFLQFPRQTLEYRAGDCDDLSILYAAFLEAVGMESALITVPGHIFIAASLDMAPEDAKSRFSRVDDLIFREGKTWLPIEVTMRKGGFLAAWSEGAKEWRESSARGLAGFFPVRSAWQVFEPVALPGTAALPPLQNARAVEAVKTAVETFITAEIAERAARLQADSRKARTASKATNSLGVLYAQYGLYSKAIAQFESVLAKEEYVPALVNLGHIRRLLGENEAALSYYDRAFRKAPANPAVLLAEAVVNHQMENYGVVKRYYQALKKQDPALADRYTWLDLKGEEGAKASDASGLRNTVEWVEGQ